MKGKARVTVDMTPEQRKRLKMAAVQSGMSMREFLIISAFKRIDEMEAAKQGRAVRD